MPTQMTYNDVPTLTILKEKRVFIHALGVDKRELCACFLSLTLYFVPKVKLEPLVKI